MSANKNACASDGKRLDLLRRKKDRRFNFLIAGSTDHRGDTAVFDAESEGFDDKTVVIIHPAWHSCGSHTVFCSQAAAYREMGATVLSLAVGTTPERGSRNRTFWTDYYRMTADLVADARYHTGPSRYSLLLDRRRLGRALQLVHADYAAQMAGLAELSPLPGGIVDRGKIDLIHCNHFFNMPLALRLKAQCGAPILLETHDVQSRQYELCGAKPLFSRRKSSLAEMEDTEIGLVAKADALAHINADECAYFSERLPNHKHALLYPAPRTARINDGPLFLVVASNNYPNYLSVAWLLERVLPLADPVQLAIVGNVDREFQWRAPDLYRSHQQSFKGRVDNLEAYYAAADAVLLPAVAGHGLSIKTVEALESGAPLIATRLAFRGIAVDLGKIENLRVGDTPDAFARHINEVNAEATSKPASLPGGSALPRRCGDAVMASSRDVFLELFSFPGYVDKLETLACGVASRRVELSARAQEAQSVNGPAPAAAGWTGALMQGSSRQG